MPIFLILLLFFITPVWPREINIAIVDSAFCLKNISIPKNLKKLVTIEEMAVNGHPACSAPDNKPVLSRIPHERWAHGHHVFRLLLEQLSHTRPKNTFHFTLYNVFDQQGQYTLQDWENILGQIGLKKPELVVMASAYWGEKHDALEKRVKDLHSLFLLAAGAMDGTLPTPMTDAKSLWPQASPSVDKILVGSFIRYQTQGQKDSPEGQLDTGLFEDNGLDFIVQSPKVGIYPTGSSYAVAQTTGHVLGVCQDFSRVQIFHCLEGKWRNILLRSEHKNLGNFYKAIIFSK